MKRSFDDIVDYIIKAGMDYYPKYRKPLKLIKLNKQDFLTYTQSSISGAVFYHVHGTIHIKLEESILCDCNNLKSTDSLTCEECKQKVSWLGKGDPINCKCEDCHETI